MCKKVWKSVFIGLCVVIAALVVYHLTWTPNTEGITDKARLAVERSETCDKPNNDFRYVIHFPKEWKKDYTGTPGPLPMTCMNTVSSFFHPAPEGNWAQCNYFVNHLKQLGFKQVDDPKPGDVVVFFKAGGDARHTGLYVGNSLFGALMNHSDGGKKPSNYHHHFPIWVYMVGAKMRGYVDYKFYRCVE